MLITIWCLPCREQPNLCAPLIPFGQAGHRNVTIRHLLRARSR